MQIPSFVRYWLLVAGLVVSVVKISAADSPREHLRLEANWKFHLGDDWPNALRLDKAGASGGPAAEKFNDVAWRSLDLPHDWAIELPFDASADRNHGFKPVGPAFPKNSIGWYRRTLELPAEDAGKRIWLTFDGVFRDATVWVNGWLVKRHEGGYYPFREDITDAVHFGGKNVIAVRVDATKFEGWFYEGAGIYRHVWLDKTAPVAIAPDGVFVWSEYENNSEEEIRLKGPITICSSAQIKNTLSTSQSAILISELVDQQGKHIAQAEKMINLRASSEQSADFKIYFCPRLWNGPPKGDGYVLVDYSPELWSPENPKLYKLITAVEVNSNVVDRQETFFGIRTVGFDKDKGFLLNGKPYVLKGTCNHQDHAGVGAALPDALQYFRIAKLKEFGCNAYRTSHNPPTPELLDACDHLGMIVMDESRLLGSDSENLRKWEEQIRRDRNHASVGIWSVANEEFSVQSTPQAANAARTMQNLVKSLDPTRPITYAAPQGDTFDGINGVIEVRGWNYHPGGEMDKYHAKHPDQPNVGTEQASTVCTRGIYADDKARGYVRAYDERGTQTAERWWSYFADRPWLSGGFVWTGFDYRGEPTPYSWPCISSHFGVLDTCGFPKDNFYYYQSWWTTNTVLHLLPHWNWAGKEGEEIRVDALSNCKQVELFLNGVSLGQQAMKPNSKLTWPVKYAPGTLSAKGFDAAGKVIAETKVETTGAAAAIRLTPDRTTINADGEDVGVFTVAVTDAQNRVVPAAAEKIEFTIAGAGKIIGVGNGDPSSHEPDTFIAQPPVKSLPVHGWRWKRAAVPAKGALAPEYAADFDDSTWNRFTAKTAGESILKEGESAFFRAHIQLTEADLANPGVQIRFAGIDDHGWIFVNHTRAGESKDWSAQPVYDIKKYLHAGDNVIAVGVQNDSGTGGLNAEVNVELVGKPAVNLWSRSVFNGLAQVIVQATKDAGEIKLTATADGLKPATTTIQAAAATLRPAVP